MSKIKGSVSKSNRNNVWVGGSLGSVIAQQDAPEQDECDGDEEKEGPVVGVRRHGHAFEHRLLVGNRTWNESETLKFRLVSGRQGVLADVHQVCRRQDDGRGQLKSNDGRDGEEPTENYRRSLHGD